MVFIFYFLCSIGSILLYLGLGLGLTWLLLPPFLRRYSLFLAPIIGYSYLTLIGWYLYRLDLKGTDSYAWIILAVSIFLLILAGIIFNKRRPVKTENPFSSEILVPFVVALVCFIIAMIPQVAGLNRPTTITTGNNDIASVAVPARFLKEFARTDCTGFLGFKTYATVGMADQTIFGGSLAGAFTSSVLHVQPFEIQSMLLQVFFLFGILAFYVLVREAFGYDRKGAAFITLLYGLNHVMLYVIFHGFMGQTITTGVTTAIVILHVVAVRNCRTIMQTIRFLPLAILFNWTVSVTYPHMVFFVFAPIGIFVFLMAVIQRSPSILFRWAHLTLWSLILAGILWIERAKAALNSLQVMGNAEAGWFVNWIYPDTLLGLTGGEFWLRSPSIVLRYIGTICVIGLALWGLIQTFKTDRTTFWLSLASLATISAGYTILAYKGHLEGHLGGYKSFKLLSFFFPIIFASLLLMFRRMNYHFPRNYIPITLIVLLLVGNVCSAYIIDDRAIQLRRIVDDDIIDLGKIENDPRIDSINLPYQDPWIVIWPVYFLLKKKLYVELPTYDGYWTGILAGQWRLELDEKADSDIVLITGVGSEEVLRVNNRYILRKLGSTASLKVQFGQGWESPEKVHGKLIRWTKREDQVFSIQVLSPRSSLNATAKVEYGGRSNIRDLSFYLNGILVGNPLCNLCEVDHLQLIQGENLIEFRVPAQSLKLKGTSARKMRYRFDRIEIHTEPDTEASAGKTVLVPDPFIAPHQDNQVRPR